MSFILSLFGVPQSILHAWGDIIVLLLLWMCSWGFSSVPSGKLGFLMSVIGNTEPFSKKCRGIVSCAFSRCGRHLVYILELRRGWPFETRVGSVKAGLLSSYDGQLGKLNYAWQEKTYTSGGEPGGQSSLISWHSYIGIPINFHEESGIVTFWSIELSAPLEVSNGCEALCTEEVENYGFLLGLHRGFGHPFILGDERRACI